MENKESKLTRILVAAPITGVICLVGLVFLFLGFTFLPVIGALLGLAIISFGCAAGIRILQGPAGREEMERTALASLTRTPDIIRAGLAGCSGSAGYFLESNAPFTGPESARPSDPSLARAS
ncbi:MAG: hypothetical protein AB1641_24400 [Thermodesulfobacteriota bacterium]